MSMIRRFSVFASFFLLAAPVEARKPNVVLIMVDDLGYQDLGCFGHPEIRDRSSDFSEMIDAMRTRAEVFMAEIRAGKILPIVKP